ncbi:twin-arginine translocation signal domain-containing protein [Azospirillum sp.]|uniref:twin-arginine translocation signal domain-containing protein n=1 Tax=Azospirillum sp. TaxID=34012 RepID=UPI002D74E07B|nr:twin-arginine translocation signal domain-containing protein [Azospirillum sp.]HYD69511.1 twin-arginine translocation signal domain-containing protein [Azospirillum sp.]
MSRNDDKAGIARSGIERRDLLKGLGLGTIGAAAAATAVPGAADAAESPQEQVKQRYQETEHVKRFYALNRL